MTESIYQQDTRSGDASSSPTSTMFQHSLCFFGFVTQTAFATLTSGRSSSKNCQISNASRLNKHRLLSEATHSPLVIPFGVVIPEVGWSSIFTARPQCDHQTIHTASVSIVCVSLSLSILLFLIPFSLFPLRSRAVLSLFLSFFPSFFLSFTIAIFPSFFRRYISASCR